ncbi:DUF3429 domain-containing protein [Novosphingobium olei]|uniref:DUF3429 domain-containing protein n=1 Tax=Novosphingobium olei TaxID=2728851 RepID=UPI0030909493|nr:DUF3429 domain-containing protein [Novosphingobium olei]
MSKQVQGSARWLGVAGLLPQLAALVAAHTETLHWSAIAAGCVYAALIFSFLGGIWWVQALLADRQSLPDHLLAVTPSLIALAAMLPWCFGLPWPGPSLVVLGTCLLASPFVDARLAKAMPLPQSWLALRRRLSTGLGLLTLALAFA